MRREIKFKYVNVCGIISRYLDLSNLGHSAKGISTLDIKGQSEIFDPQNEKTGQ